MLLAPEIDVEHRQLGGGCVAAGGMVAEADPAPFQGNQGILEAGQGAAELLHRRPGDLAAVAREEDPLAEALIEELRLHLLFGLHVVDLLLVADAEQWRLGDVDVPRGDELIHLPVEERQQERADVRAVDVGVGHDHDLVVATLAEIGVGADAGADRGDDAAHLLVGKHLVFPALVGVDDLAAQREDRLVLAVSSPLRRAAGRITLHEVQLAAGHVATGAVAELAGKPSSRERPLPLAEERLGLEGRRAGLGSEHALLDDRLGVLRILLEVLGEEVTDGGVDDPLHFAVAELRLCLPLELRVGNADAHHHGEALTDVVASGHEILVEARLLAVGIE